MKTCSSIHAAGEGSTLHNGQYGEASPERGTIFRLRGKKGQGFHQLKYKKGKSVIVSCERA